MLDSCLVSGSYTLTHVSSAVMTLSRNRLPWLRYRFNEAALSVTLCSFCSSVRRRGIHLAHTFLIPSSLAMMECTDAVHRPTFNEMSRNVNLLSLSNNALINPLL